MCTKMGAILRDIQKDVSFRSPRDLSWKHLKVLAEESVNGLDFSSQSDWHSKAVTIMLSNACPSAYPSFEFSYSISEGERGALRMAR
jgi:hypothetical protein